MLGTILSVLLILALIGTLPGWPHSWSWDMIRPAEWGLSL